MTARKLFAAIKNVTRLSTGFLTVNRYELEIEKHAGGRQIRTWEVMERGNSVAVLGYDAARDAVVLVNEMRPGVLVNGEYPFTDNLVAGGMAPGESALDAAAREMKEETGLDLHDAQLIHPGAYVSSGGTSEKIALVMGRVDTSIAGGIHGNANESEDALTVVLPAEDFIARARRAEITDFKTLLAAYWLTEHRRARKEWKWPTTDQS